MLLLFPAGTDPSSPVTSEVCIPAGKSLGDLVCAWQKLRQIVIMILLHEATLRYLYIYILNGNTSLSIQIICSENKSLMDEMPDFGSLIVSPQHLRDAEIKRELRGGYTTVSTQRAFEAPHTLRFGEHVKAWAVLCIQDAHLCVLCKQES